MLSGINYIFHNLAKTDLLFNIQYALKKLFQNMKS